jgi:hypothetical protein
MTSARRVKESVDAAILERRKYNVAPIIAPDGSTTRSDRPRMFIRLSTLIQPHLREADLWRLPDLRGSISALVVNHSDIDVASSQIQKSSDFPRGPAGKLVIRLRQPIEDGAELVDRIIGSYQRIQPQRGMRYLVHAPEWKADANATREKPFTCFPRPARREHAIRRYDLGSVSCRKPSGRWTMDWEADTLLRRFHRRKSEPADGRESCRYHAIRCIGVGIWMGSAVAWSGCPANVCRWSFEIWDTLRC